ncbi:hypothetical protein DM860_001742 [Cuscuta australis]|uniref:Inner centromere protein ARK-binding domain-containing protein n=1 Tax=Cuscuta australis TaxID=267555 RepID=A0A328E9H3_9ASTE|nr:hypothetical protein DM860_001742 [Cuscuta australis]
MTTAEKLLVQLFERRDWIIDQARQQAELYDHHIASKLLVHGITPPCWLGNPNPSSHSTQWNKEELISELLIPHTQRRVHYQTAHYSHNTKPVVRDYPEVWNGFCAETHASNIDVDMGEGPSMVDGCLEIDVENNLDVVSELDCSVSSPVDHGNARISNVYSVPDQSLARIQRSKSRQKALELRNSAKSVAKNHPRNEERNDGSTGGIRMPSLESECVDHFNVAPKSPEPSAVSCHIYENGEMNTEYSQGLGDGSDLHAVQNTRFDNSANRHIHKESPTKELKASEREINSHLGSNINSRSFKIFGDIKSKGGDSQSVETGKDIDVGRTTKSWTSSISCRFRETCDDNSQVEKLVMDKQHDKSITPKGSAKQASCACDPVTLYPFADVIAQENDAAEIGSLDDLSQQPCCARKPLKLVDPSNLSKEFFADKEETLEDGLPQNDEASKFSRGLFGRSNCSSKQNECVNRASNPNIDSSFSGMDRGILSVPSDIVQENDNCNIFSAGAYISDGPLHKRRSEDSCYNKLESDPANNSSASGLKNTQFILFAAEKFVSAGNELENSLGCQVIHNIHCKTSQKEIGDTIVENKLETDKVVEDHSSSYKLDNLDSDIRKDLECLAEKPPSDCFMLVKPKQLDFDHTEGSNVTLLTVKRKRTEKSAEVFNTSQSLSDKDSTDNKIEPTEKVSLVEPKVHSELREDWRKSVEFNVSGDFQFEVARDESTTEKHLDLKNMKNDSKPAYTENSPCTNKEDVMLPKAGDTPDLDLSNLNASCEQGHGSSPHQQAEGGECRSEGKDGSAACSYASRHKHSVPTDLSSFTIEAVDGSQNPLVEEVVYEYSTKADTNHKSFSDKSIRSLAKCPGVAAIIHFPKAKEHQDGIECGCEGKDGSPTSSHKHSVPTNFSRFLEGAKGDSQSSLPEKVVYGLSAERVANHRSFSDKLTGRSPHLERGGSSCLASSAGVGVKISDPEARKLRDANNTHLSPDTSCKSFEVKRRKTEDQHVDCCIASSMEEMQKLYKDLKDVRCSSVSNLGNKSPQLTTKPNVKNDEGIGSPPEDQRDKDGLDFLETNNNHENLPAVTAKSSEVILRTRFVAEATEDITGGCLAETITTLYANSITPNVEIGRDEHILNLEYIGYQLNPEKSVYTETHPLERKSVPEEDPLFPQCSVPSPQGKNSGLFYDDQAMSAELASGGRFLSEVKPILDSSIELENVEDLDIKIADKTMPVFEGFIINSQAEIREWDVDGNVVNIDKLGLPRSTIARASILEHICKSASACTHLSDLSSSLESQRYHHLFQTLPNGLLEQTDVPDIQFVDEDYYKQSSASLTDVNKGNSSLEAMPSEYVPCSGSRFGLTSVKQYTSPVGKIWESFSTRKGSSGKSRSSNPELTCFTIEEDRCISDGNEIADEHGDEVQEENEMLVENNLKRKHDTSVALANLKPPASISRWREFVSRGSVDSTNEEASCIRTRSKVKRKLGNSYSNKGEGKENLLMSKSAIGTEMAKVALTNRYSRPKLSSKASLRNEPRKLSEKELKRNNIVSNVTSFIPLVKQKQAAEVCTGKRDIKVKALEAAEAVKRLEAKRENERKARKEAMKLERAKMEQENAKQAELEKRKKEEERMRKDADMAARKRRREEEERKEKEKKKKRIDETHRQKKQEDRLHSQKVDKEKLRLDIDGEMMSKKETEMESKNHQAVGKERGDDITCKRLEGEPQDISSSKQCTASSQSCDNKQGICTPKSSICKGNFIQEKSYEISPYQCSDDEEEEEVDDLHTKKFIPEWASKSSVAMALPLQLDLDFSFIFHLDRSYSMDEILLSRKVQKKQ